MAADQEALQAALAVDLRRAAISRAERAARRADRDVEYETFIDPAPMRLNRESLRRELGEF